MYSLHPHFQILYSLRNIDEVRLKRAEDRQKQKEKCSNVQIFTGATFPHVGARVHYYIRENTVNDATNTDNTNIDCDDEAFENMPDNGKEPVSNNSEPYIPLPLLFDDYQWPKPLDEILTFAETKPACLWVNHCICMPLI
ncbi:MAG: hypothetical protein MR968_06920 [Prevotella sp.]|nr:hypothetical protein [Prevotella sp.]